ncbi:MAG TPA: hypothetical protein VEY12_06590 [Thermoplasmata archaeon]|nr:hypothetical protein [Thermoplasmata archaeon]
MRQVRLYRILTAFCLWAAGAAAVLMAVALALSRVFEASAAALCAAVFFVPGLLFLRQWRRLHVRELALAHAAKLADDAGVTDGRSLAKELDVPEADATKILRTAVREGHLHGEVDASGRFVSATAPRCPACGSAVPRTALGKACPSCGAAVPGGT